MRRAVPIVLFASVVTSVVAGCRDEPVADPGPTTEVTTAETTAPPDAGRPNATTVPNVLVDDERGDTVVPDGFERVQATVTEPDGTVCELCLWLADTPVRRSKGLMFVTGLGPADGMAFLYPAMHTGNFWMRNTRLPLSIAFFGVDGAHLGAFDMEPCTADPCPMYRTPDDFLVAIETTQGGLAGLGIGPGSVLELADAPCADAAADTPG